MKTTFWKNLSFLVFGIVIVISLILIIVILSINIKPFWIVILSGSIILSLLIIIITTNKQCTSKVNFSESEIKIIHLHNVIKIINWNEITSVTSTPYGGRFSYYLTFNTCDEQINLDITQKMYNAIMDICPNPNIKMAIKNIERFKWFYKRYESKKIND